MTEKFKQPHSQAMKRSTPEGEMSEKSTVKESLTVPQTDNFLEIEMPENPVKPMALWGLAPDGDSDQDTTCPKCGGEMMLAHRVAHGIPGAVMADSLHWRCVDCAAKEIHAKEAEKQRKMSIDPPQLAMYKTINPTAGFLLAGGGELDRRVNELCSAPPCGGFDFTAAENTLIDVCQLVDGFKVFAQNDGQWSERDQGTYNALQSLLVSVSQNAGDLAPPP